VNAAGFPPENFVRSDRFRMPLARAAEFLRAVPDASRNVARGMQHNVYQFGAQIVLLPAITGIDPNVLPPEALLRHSRGVSEASTKVSAGSRGRRGVKANSEAADPRGSRSQLRNMGKHGLVAGSPT
jgi:hypothetical protein